MEEMDQKTSEMLAAEREKVYKEHVEPVIQQSGKPNYASEKDAERAALRGLKWLKKHPNASLKEVPGHIREKLAIARHMMGIAA